MAYTNVWSDSTPLGTAAANTIDDIFRALKVDIEQRLIDLHGMPDFTSDPLKTNYIRVGYGTSTKGGYVAISDDTNTLRWQVGLRSTAAATSFAIRDVVAGSDRMIIDSAGLLSTAAGITTAGTVAVYRANATDSVFQGTRVADIHARYYMQADGKMFWGNGTDTQDTNFYRQSAGLLKTDGNLAFNTITSGTWNGSVISDTYTQAKLITAPTGGRTVTNVTTYLANNALFNVKDFGAVGDGVTDDTAAIQDAIDAAELVSGCVFVPAGEYAIPTTQLVVPAGVSIVGVGSGKGGTFGSRFLWGGTTFLFKLGATAGSLSYSMGIEKIGINISVNSGCGITVYGAAHSYLRDIYIEGNATTSSGTAIQIDGADTSCFFITMEGITVNHMKKGYVHTTTGTVNPTQVTGINCSALCDNITGSIGIEIQSVGGVGCGDGVLYTGGNMEACKIGIYTNAGGSTFNGVRFENPQGTSDDIKFDTLARNNCVEGCNNVYTITNVSGSYTNQVLATNKDRLSVVSQENILDATTIKTLTVAGFIIGTPTIGASSDLLFASNGTTARNILVSASSSYAGSLFLQAGGRSAGFGGSLIMYGHSHATHPGDVVAGISVASGGSFRVNNQALDGGTDLFKATTGLVVVPDALTVGTTATIAGLTTVGRLKGSGSTPTLTGIHANAGSISITGTATAGKIEFTATGTINANTTLFVLNYSTYGAVPYVMVNSNRTARLATTTVVTATTAIVDTVNAYANGETGYITYHIIA